MDIEWHRTERDRQSGFNYLPSMSSYMMTTMFMPMSGTTGGSQPALSKMRGMVTTRTSHDGSNCTYEVDKSALHANVLRRVPISTPLVIILLKPGIVWWRNGRPSDCKGRRSCLQV